jgi:hypothetical protein
MLIPLETVLAISIIAFGVGFLKGQGRERRYHQRLWEELRRNMDLLV